MTAGTLGFIGDLKVKHNTLPKAPLSWRIHNTLRAGYIKGWLAHRVARLMYKVFQTPTLLGRLEAVKVNVDGSRVQYGTLGYRVITTAFAEFMVDSLKTTDATFADFKWHDSGVGTVNENVTDVGMGTTDGESRQSGTQVEGTSVQYKSVGTIAYTSTKAITEHGLFNIVTDATPVLMDRTKFAAVNVVNGESIEFTYTLTVTAGS